MWVVNLSPSCSQRAIKYFTNVPTTFSVVIQILKVYLSLTNLWHVEVGLEDDCEDINECEERAGVCGAGRCLNTEGGYQCECDRGFVAASDGRECLDTRRGICYNKVTAGRYLVLLPFIYRTVACWR